MIEYLKENYTWLGAIVVPVLVAIIGVIAAFAKKSGRKQRTGDIKGNGNKVINGDVNVK